MKAIRANLSIACILLLAAQSARAQSKYRLENWDVLEKSLGIAVQKSVDETKLHTENVYLFEESLPFLMKDPIAASIFRDGDPLLWQNMALDAPGSLHSCFGMFCLVRHGIPGAGAFAFKACINLPAGNISLMPDYLNVLKKWNWTAADINELVATLKAGGGNTLCVNMCFGSLPPDVLAGMLMNDSIGDVRADYQAHLIAYMMERHISVGPELRSKLAARIQAIAEIPGEPRWCAATFHQDVGFEISDIDLIADFRSILKDPDRIKRFLVSETVEHNLQFARKHRNEIESGFADADLASFRSAINKTAPGDPKSRKAMRQIKCP